MRTRVLAIALTAALSLTIVPSASAAEEVGESCTATGTEANRTLLVFNSIPGPPLKPVVPEEPAQVITSWKVRVGPGIAPLPQRLEVYRVLNEEQDYRKEAESATVMLGEGLNVFPTRIPVQSWTGYIGLYGSSGTLVCSPGPQLAGSFEGAAAVGETRRVKGVVGIGVPVTVTTEDDRDRDGYGDETQDACPQSAAYQGACPTVALHIVRARVRRHSIVLRVRANVEATVHVFGQVGWGFKPNPKLKTAGAKPTHLIVGLRGGAKTVAPGRATEFRVQLPKSVLRRLGRITPRESLKAKLTATTTELSGRHENERLTVRLKGRDSGG